jgi:zinc transport system ATP-binding protein
MKLITCENISLGYEGKLIQKNLNFAIQRGVYLSVIGENGSGKTTLLKTLLGLKSPVEGRIFTGDLIQKNQFGYLPQQTIIQKDFPASVEEIVFSGFINQSGLRPFYTKGEKKRAREIIEKLNLQELKQTCYRELSGGQQQRVLLARALCASVEILFLDEPAASLDPIVTKELYVIVKQLHQEGMTIVMISHDVSAVLEYSSHILQLGQSEYFFGTKEEYLQKKMEMGGTVWGTV